MVKDHLSETRRKNPVPPLGGSQEKLEEGPEMPKEARWLTAQQSPQFVWYICLSHVSELMLKTSNRKLKMKLWVPNSIWLVISKFQAFVCTNSERSPAQCLESCNGLRNFAQLRSEQILEKGLHLNPHVQPTHGSSAGGDESWICLATLDQNIALWCSMIEPEKTKYVRHIKTWICAIVQQSQEVLKLQQLLQVVIACIPQQDERWNHWNHQMSALFAALIMSSRPKFSRSGEAVTSTLLNDQLVLAESSLVWWTIYGNIYDTNWVTLASVELNCLSQV